MRADIWGEKGVHRALVRTMDRDEGALYVRKTEDVATGDGGGLRASGVRVEADVAGRVRMDDEHG